VDHASHYLLNLGTDPNFSPGTFAVCRTANPTFTVGNNASGPPCMPSQGGTYYWRVRAIDDPKGVTGIYSDIHSFVYESSPVQLTAPADGATVAVPTLRWASAREAVKYHVEVKGTGGGNVATDTHSLSWTPNLDAARSPFTWTVQAVDADGKRTPLRPGRTFSIAGSPVDTPASPLTPLTGTPSDPPTTRFPSLSWEPHPEADYYKVRIGTHGSNFWDTGKDSFLTEKREYPAGTSTDNGYLNPGQYDWQVVAYDAANAEVDAGPISTFTITDLPVVTGQRLALTGTALDDNETCEAALSDPDGSDQCTNVPATPVLDWDPVPGAGYYMIYLSQDRDLTNLVYGSSTNSGSVPTTSNTRWTPSMSEGPSALPDSQAGKAYYWYIRPCKAPGKCAPDPVSVVDAATHAFSKRSPKPVLTGPANGGTAKNDVTFTWQDYLATNQAHAYPATGEVSYQSGRQYRIEVSTKDDFTSLVDAREVDQTTYTPFDRTYPEGKLYWRVQGIDAAGNHLAWSDTASFTKDSEVPTLVSPTGDAHTSGLTAFRWDTTPFAAQYRIEVYKNNDTTFSPANRAFAAKVTKQTAYAHNLPLPASSVPYVWRVQRLDASGKPGNWSATGRFYSTGSAPALVSPASGALVRGNDAYFSWTDVPGAARYLLEYKLSTATSSSKVTTAAQSWAPVSTFADGSYQWRVTALDAANVAIGTSAWRGFRVDATRPTVTSVKPAAGATGVKPGANMVANFSEKVTNVSTTTVKLYRKGSSKPVAAKVTLSSTKRYVVVNPKRDLARGTKYTVKLSTGIRDLSGLSLVAKSWSFKTR
jgi:hypothetical protein